MNTPPPTADLSSQLQMGAVKLFVNNLETETFFYHSLIGLEILYESHSEVLLGYHNREVIQLLYSPDLSPSPPGSAGLYHLAIVFESRSVLAEAVKNILLQDPARYSGTADHLVSEAFYFSDPEGNGVELYFDKDETTWQWQDGKIVMASIYIDPEDYIRKHQDQTESRTKKIGHVHLRVGDIEKAYTFYINLLGFAETLKMPTALFISNGRYHHHLGMNTWESLGAERKDVSLGLNSFQVYLPATSDLERLKNRLTDAMTQITTKNSVLEVKDPWGNKIEFVVNGSVF